MIAAGLRRLGTPPASLLAPVGLDLVAGFLNVVALALWLPLLNGVLAGDVRGGRRFRLIAELLPDRLARDGDPLTIVAAFAVLMLLATLVRSACSLTADRITERLTGAAEARLAERLLRGHLRLGQAYFDRIKPALTVRNLQKLPAKCARLLPWLCRVVTASLELVLLLALMTWLSPRLALAAIVALPVYGLLMRRMTARAERQLADDEEIEEAATASTHELVANLLLVRLHGVEDRTLAAHRDRTTARLEAQRRGAARLALSDELRSGFNVVLLLLFVTLTAWAMGARQGAMLSSTLAFFFVFRRAMSTFSALLKLPARWVTVRGNLETLEALLSIEEEEQLPSGERRLIGIRDGIAVRGLTFAYPGGEPVLRDVDLEIPRGRLTAIVGHNGSGKSTLLKLLLRLYDCPPASILVDGVDLRELDLAQLRARTAWADAAPPLFRDTLRGNLVYGQSDVTPQRLAAALDASGLQAVVEGLRDGLEHVLGAGERSLSAGEQQRLGIARLLLRDADLLLLDEALASLDADGEYHVLGHLARLAADRCVVVVTHRPEALPASTWTITLDEGRVVAQRESPARGEWEPLPAAPRPATRSTVAAARRFAG